MWIGVIMFCSNLDDVNSCQAFIRNNILFETEAECRETVPKELNGMLKLDSGIGHSNYLPLPQLGISPPFIYDSRSPLVIKVNTHGINAKTYWPVS
jgi:hypothetical protein